MSRDPSLEAFYHSKEWTKLRKLKIQLSLGICEECGKKGNEVHHKIALTPSNVADLNISMNLDNLQLLCHECHNSKRKGAEIRSDLKFDSEGNVVAKIE